VTVDRLLSLFGRLGWPFLVPAKTASAVARSRGQGRPPGRRAGRASLDGGEHGRTLAIDGIWTRTPRARRATFCFFLLLAAGPAGFGHAAEAPGNATSVANAVQEASLRFGVPTGWIDAVIAAESGGDAGARSTKGAMGLMQLMPATWRELSAEIGLGDDAFDRRSNVIAGTAYLRRLYDRFGRRGFLAAYNAGPTRYQAVLDGKGRLPAQTVAYVAQVEARIGWRNSGPHAEETTRPRDWRVSGLFAATRNVEPATPDAPSMISVIEPTDHEPHP
jgi:soluble lytic murein transglycosylase-like protein